MLSHFSVSLCGCIAPGKPRNIRLSGFVAIAAASQLAVRPPNFPKVALGGAFVAGVLLGVPAFAAADFPAGCE